MGSTDLIRSVLLVMMNQGHSSSLSPIFHNLTRDGFTWFMVAHSGVANIGLICGRVSQFKNGVIIAHVFCYLNYQSSENSADQHKFFIQLIPGL